VGNLPSKFGTLGFWVLELFAMYATDGLTEGRKDERTNATHNNNNPICKAPKALASEALAASR